MSFSTPLPHRADLVLESWTLLDGSGDFTSDWFDSSGFGRALIAVTFNGGTPTVRLDEGQYDSSFSTPRVIRSQSIAVSGNRGFLDTPLTGRFFQLVITGGSADNPFAATIRGLAS